MKPLLAIMLISIGACGDVTSDLVERTESLCSSECPVQLPHCNPQSQQCVECTDNAHCKDPAYPLCDVDAGRCVECLFDGHCGEPKERCSVVLGECAVTCATPSDCPVGDPICDPAILFCIECLSDADCSEPTPHCRKSECSP